MKSYASVAGDRWANIGELKAAGARHTFGVSEKGMPGGPMLHWSGSEAYLLPVRHTAILGGTGAGKTQSVLLPALLASIDQGESCIVNDPKGGELYRYTAEYAKARGYKVIVLNFSAPEKSARWNCFSVVEDSWKRGDQFLSDQYLSDIAQVIYERHIHDAKDPFWGQAASQYFTGLAQIARQVGSPITFESIMKLHLEGKKKIGIEAIIKRWLECFDRDNKIRANLSVDVDAPNDTRLSIEAVFSAPMNEYCQSGLSAMTARNSFDYAEFGTERCIVYLVTPPIRSTFDPLVSLFVKQAISVLTEGEPLRRPVTFFLEEFSSLPKIVDLDLAISMARSYNIRFILCAQNSEQLRARYGDSTDTIINNCGCLYVMRSKDRKFYEQYIQPLCGTKILPHSERSYPLVSFSDIQHFRCGQVLILLDGVYPCVTQFPQIGELGVPLKESHLCDIPKQPDAAPPAYYSMEQAVKEEHRRRTEEAMREAESERIQREWEMSKSNPFRAGQVHEKAEKVPPEERDVIADDDDESDFEFDEDAIMEALIDLGLDGDEDGNKGGDEAWSVV